MGTRHTDGTPTAKDENHQRVRSIKQQQMNQNTVSQHTIYVHHIERVPLWTKTTLQHCKLVACGTNTVIVIVIVIVVITLPSNKQKCVTADIIYCQRNSRTPAYQKCVKRRPMTMVLLHRSTRRTVKKIGHILSLCTSLFLLLRVFLGVVFPPRTNPRWLYLLWQSFHPFIHPSLLWTVQFNNCFQLATHEHNSFLINSSGSCWILLSFVTRYQAIRKTHKQ